MNINEKIISAVIACYKDEQAIPLMHERLTKTFMLLINKTPYRFYHHFI